MIHYKASIDSKFELSLMLDSMNILHGEQDFT